MAYTAMGDYGGPYEEDNSFSDNAERKTDNPKKNPDGNAAADTDTKIKVDQTGESNVLNSYRSMTYNFTLAALKKGYLSDPKKYRESELDLIILKSGGKGDAKIKVSAGMNNDQISQQARSDFAARDPRRVDISDEQKSAPLKDYGTELVDGFNTRSPGRFDMFIENVEKVNNKTLVIKWNEKSNQSDSILSIDFLISNCPSKSDLRSENVVAEKKFKFTKVEWVLIF